MNLIATQQLPVMNFRSGSIAESLKVSKTGPLYPLTADILCAVGMTAVGQRAALLAARTIPMERLATLAVHEVTHNSADGLVDADPQKCS